MSIAQQRINRRSFIKLASSHILMATALNRLQVTTSLASLAVASPSSHYGSGSYGSLTYGWPLAFEDPTPRAPDSQIFLPIIVKEKK